MGLFGRMTCIDTPCPQKIDQARTGHEDDEGITATGHVLGWFIVPISKKDIRDARRRGTTWCLCRFRAEVSSFRSLVDRHSGSRLGCEVKELFITRMIAWLGI